MAIAVLAEEVEAPGGEWLEVPWPRPTLRLVGAAEQSGGPVREAPSGSGSVVRGGVASAAARAAYPGMGAASPPRGADVALRYRRRARALRRRRLVLGAAAAASLAVILALPVQVLGGAAPSPAPVAAAAGQAIYTVQPGDTLWSIAERFDHGADPRALAAVLARQTGSAAVVPGERIAIP